jgi:glycosyltransferase involved in cell wall biosynthesis
MISVLIPIYNGIEFIEESVGSVLQQTFTDWELLIGVNGHPENSETYQLAKRYEQTNKINKEANQQTYKTNQTTSRRFRDTNKQNKINKK